MGELGRQWLCIDRGNWPGDSGSLDAQFRQTVWGAMGGLCSPKGVCELTETMVGTLGREEPLKEMERPVREVIENRRVGLGKSQKGRLCCTGPLVPDSAAQPLTLCWGRENSEQRW